MKIVHIIIADSYREGWGYQQNILPAKHKELGNNVYIITKAIAGHSKEGDKYINKDGVEVSVMKFNHNRSSFNLINLFQNITVGLYDSLVAISPDIIFIHGLQAIDNLEVCRYKKKHPNVKVYVDQHGDYYNMPVKPLKNYLIQKIFFKRIAKKLEKVSERMWGVTPWRVDYLQKVYNVSPEKTGLLVMGGDEKMIDWENRATIRKEVREKHNIPENAFLIVTGGKIDKAKNIHILIEAFNQIDREDVYLMIFGNYNEEMENMCKPMFNDRIINLGWIDSRDVYPLFLASDLAVFPGTHSVLWEQVCAAGLPAIFKDWDGGMSHVDVGGNCILMKEINTESIKNTIKKIITDKETYDRMSQVAQTTARSTFSYIEIAKKAIEHIEQ